MRKLRIVSDSSSDVISLDFADYSYSPMKVITSEREFVDDEKLDVDEMIRFFDKYKGKSKSSCPNVKDWISAFGDADDVICMTITRALSGSYNAACCAKQIFEADNSGKRVFVLDTLTAGPELSLIIKKAEELIKSGISYEEICERLAKYHKKTGLVFMLKSLKNFASNGRVSPIIAKIVGIVGICIVGKASDEGTLEPLQKCRGEASSLDRIVQKLEEFGLKEGNVSIGHAQNEQGAERLKEMIHSKFEKVKIEIHKLRGLCSFYVEKGGLLVGFEKM